ncbi:hypothetical protein RS84_02862 [Microbacterium hydrocarbonoxydans]|uniref:HTH cro/C1-type domain-containing protein n=2 Tax=Microbacterium hydrocarbonoxydans TaxID=273678 RepID=A0A0M2HHQ4_9MICO|nr:hypothetical protein RS84_02862 [Microbacterium hydrocarbonoxydans]
MSQKDLASAMRDRGWKWSQATVWSIEKGERPLRLAEAVDVAWVLDERLDALLRKGVDQGIEQILRDPKRSLERLLDELTVQTSEYERPAALLRDLDLPITAWGARTKLADVLDGLETARAESLNTIVGLENDLDAAEDELWTAIRTGYMGHDDDPAEG